ncbi:hypothetical protein CPAV1605_1345 [seawater metagenome]|uniref:Uncharacterized protein n=1 Tax=seawater metagenome TaxID=1561972 RepID=A0A5E8CJJ9_9ZZZZ
MGKQGKNIALVLGATYLLNKSTETKNDDIKDRAKKSKTLKNTQKKGFVRCGVSQGLTGFSNADVAGN